MRRFVELAAFVVRADDEHAHVARAGRLDRRPVQVVDEIPVQVDVIELAAVDRLEDDVGGGVGGEAEEADAALLLELARRGHAAVLA